MQPGKNSAGQSFVKLQMNGWWRLPLFTHDARTKSQRCIGRLICWQETSGKLRSGVQRHAVVFSGHGFACHSEAPRAVPNAQKHHAQHRMHWGRKKTAKVGSGTNTHQAPVRGCMEGCHELRRAVHRRGAVFITTTSKSVRSSDFIALLAEHLSPPTAVIKARYRYEGEEQFNIASFDPVSRSALAASMFISRPPWKASTRTSSSFLARAPYNPCQALASARGTYPSSPQNALLSRYPAWRALFSLGAPRPMHILPNRNDAPGPPLPPSSPSSIRARRRRPAGGEPNGRLPT